MSFAQGPGETPEVIEQEIRVDSADEIHLSGLLISREDTPAHLPLVVLFHALGRDRDGLIPLADAIAKAMLPAPMNPNLYL